MNQRQARQVVALVAIAGLFVLLVVLTACGSEEDKDAPRSPDDNTAPAQVIRFPNGYRNVAHKCDGPNMVYSASRGPSMTDQEVAGSVAVVPNDYRCTLDGSTTTTQVPG